MRTYLNKEGKYVAEKPEVYWSGLCDSITGEKIYKGDRFQILNGRGLNGKVTLECSEEICNYCGTYFYKNYYIYNKLGKES